jgi:hypothetical protein
MSYHRVAWLPQAAVEAAAPAKARNFLQRTFGDDSGAEEGTVDGVDPAWLVPDRVIERLGAGAWECGGTTGCKGARGHAHVEFDGCASQWGRGWDGFCAVVHNTCMRACAP